VRGSAFVAVLCLINSAKSERELLRIEARLAEVDPDSRREHLLERLAARRRELAAGPAVTPRRPEGST
jgi:hypothetical protein